MRNKRKHPRYGIASIAEITFRDSEETIEALISTIGKGGIGIYSSKQLPTGLELTVRISFLQTNGNEEVTEIIPGRVMWSRVFHNNYVIGIAFTTFDSVKQSLLLSYLEAASQGTA